MRISHQTRLVLQAFLDAPGNEMYGFALTQTTGVKAGTLYPILERLSAEGWLNARWEDIDEHAAARRRRRYYQLTAVGEQHARVAIGNDKVALRQLMPRFAT
jgi:PadR family transcriptional regulator PadR